MKEWSKRFVLGITGSMGSGKSVVTKNFESLGAFRISADEIAHSFTAVDSPIKTDLIELFGEKILNENGVLDRKKIAGIVFSDKNAIEKLNGFLHPLIRKKTLDLIQLVDNGRVVAWEAPLLFEAKGENICDATLTVSADYKNSWERVQKRDSISEEEFRNRLANQMDIKKKLDLSDFKIINDKDLTHLSSECNAIYSLIMSKRLSL